MGLQGAVRGRKSRSRPSPIAAAPGRPIWWIVEFRASRPERALGRRLHLCRDLVGVRLCRLRHRRVLAPDRRLAGLGLDADATWRSTRWSRLCGPVPDSETLVHHSDRGSQYLSIRYTERLAEAGLEPSVGSVGDSYDNALAEIDHRPVQDRGHPSARARGAISRTSSCDPGMGRLVQQPRLLEPIGYVPPAEFEERYHRDQQSLAMVVGLN